MNFQTFLLACTICLNGVTALTAQPNKTPSLPKDSLPENIEFVRELDGIEEYRLTSNDLRILLLPNEGIPVATVMVTYEVGSRNEVTGTTGATHILEHMMFKGTQRFTQEAGTDYSSQMERIGARSNATTYFDRTNYYATLPREFVPLAIELEADRMRNLQITADDLASEMTVVRNEYERGENNPVRTLIKEVFAAAFIAQPYAHPTIGWLSDIENTSPEKLRNFYDTFYWPENAVLSVIGGIDREETLSAVAKFYGDVPRSPKSIPAVDTIEPEQLGARRLILERAGQVGVVMIAYKVPEGTHEDWATLTVLKEIVGADKTGRLYRALEDKGKASATFTFAPQLRDPGLFMFASYLTPDSSHEENEATILDEIQTLISSGVTEDELARAKSVIQANTVYGRDGPYAIADEINETIAMGDWTQYATLPKAVQNVTIEEVKAVAAKYFIKKNSTTGWFVPKTSRSTEVALGQPGFQGNYYRDPQVFRQPRLPNGPLKQSSEADSVATNSRPETPLVDFSSNMQTATVAGIDIVAVDLPIESVVSFVGSFAAGSALSPVDSPALASLTAEMLDKGTLTLDRFTIAEQLNTLGAQMGFSANAHSLGFSGRFLRKDAGSVMNLLAKQLREPAFDPEVFETLKSRQKTWILNAMDDPDYRAKAAVNQLLYPVGHPNYSTPLNTLIEDLEATTIEELSSFHTDFYGPESMTLVFAGDIDFAQLKAAVETAFSGWDGGVDYPSDVLNQLPNQEQFEKIEIADKASVSVHYGYNTSLQRTNPDYLPFMVGNYVLGASFNSRLMTEVRKNQGLTYNIRSYHEGDILTPGNWAMIASFAPEIVEKGMKAADSVVINWHKNGITEEEFVAAIETLSGSYVVGLSTTGRVASQILSFMQRGFSAEYIDEYPEKLKALNREMVNKAIGQYFDPTNKTRAMAGSLIASAEKAPKEPEGTEISILLDAPDPSWSIDIEAVYLTNETLIAVSKLSQTPNPTSQVLTTVADSVQVGIKTELPIQHYILGKTWNWGEAPTTIFIKDESELASITANAQLLEFKEE